MIVAIHQPNYIPWIGYFYKIIKADKFVFLDNVMFSKNSFINRNKIKTPNGAMWLTVPVLFKGHYGEKIKDIKINNKFPWQNKHLKSLLLNYSKAQYFPEISELVRPWYENTKWEYLVDLNIKIITDISKYLKIDVTKKFVLASELNVSGKSTDLLINICKKLGANTYLSGIGAKKYQEVEKFEEAGIELVYSRFRHPEYKQLYSDFIENLSILDLLFNMGPHSLMYILNEH